MLLASTMLLAQTPASVYADEAETIVEVDAAAKEAAESEAAAKAAAESEAAAKAAAESEAAAKAAAESEAAAKAAAESEAAAKAAAESEAAAKAAAESEAAAKAAAESEAAAKAAAESEAAAKAAAESEAAAKEAAESEAAAKEAAESEAAAQEAAQSEAAAESETPAPATEKETGAQETVETQPQNDGLIETETGAAISEPSAIEAHTEKETEKQTEAQTEAQTEEETSEQETEEQTEEDTEEDSEPGKTSKLQSSLDNISITVTFDAKHKVNDGSVLTVRKETEKSASKALAAVKSAAAEGYRETGSLIAYRLVFEDEDGEEFVPAGSYTVAFTYKKAQDLKLNAYQQPEASVWQYASSKAKQLGTAVLNEKAKAVSFKVKAAGDGVLVLAGIQNHTNKGDKITASSLKSELGQLLSYAVVADEADAEVEMIDSEANTDKGILTSDTIRIITDKKAAADTADEVSAQDTSETETAYADDYTAAEQADGQNDTADAEENTASGQADIQDENGNADDADEQGTASTDTAAADQETEIETETETAEELVQELLEAGADAALLFADGRESADVTVVNLYAAADGTVDTAPLDRVLKDDSIQVTDSIIVINVAAAKADDSLSLPTYPVTGTKDGTDEETKVQLAAKVLYNITAQDGKGGFKNFTGTVKADAAVSGTILAPKAEVVLETSSMGAVYAKKVSGGSTIKKAQIGWKPAETEERTETAAGTAEAVPETLPETEKEEYYEEAENAAALMMQAAGEAEAYEAETSAAADIMNAETAAGQTDAQQPSDETDAAAAADQVNAEQPAAETAAGETTETTTEAATEEESEITPQTDASGLLVQEIVLTLTARDSSKKLAGGTFKLLYKDVDGQEQEVVFSDGTTLLTTAADQTLRVSIDLSVPAASADAAAGNTAEAQPLNAKLREVLAAEGTAEIQIIPQTAPEGYALSQRPKNGQVMHVTVVKADENETDLSKVRFSSITADVQSFTYIYALGTGLTIQAADTEGNVLEGAAVSVAAVTADGAATDIFTGTTIQTGVDFVLSADKLTEIGTILGIDAADITNLDGTALQVTQSAPSGYVAEKEGALTTVRSITLKVVDAKLQIIDQSAVAADASEEKQTENAGGTAAGTTAVDGQVTLSAPLTFVDYKNTAELPVWFRYADSKEAITGASAKIDDQDIYSDEEGKAVYSYTLTAEERTALLGGETLKKVMDSPEAVGLTVSGKSSYTYTLSINASGDVVVSTPKDPTFYFKTPTVVSKDTVKVTKYLYSNGASLTVNASKTQKYYVALCDKSGKRLTVVKTITIGKGAASRTTGSVTFRGSDGLLPNTTYYVREFTASDGKTIVPESASKIGTSDFYAVYSSGSGKQKNAVKTGSVLAGTAHTVAIANHYADGKVSDWATASASFRVTKQYFDVNGNLASHTGTFYFKVYDTDKKQYVSSKVFPLQLQNASSVTRKMTLTFTDPSAVRHLRIDETDASGNVLSSNSSYTISYVNQTFDLTPSQKNMPNAIIRNTVAPEETEPSTEEQLKATLTLTKKVTYKNAPIRVNAVYYIGIFDDEELTQLRLKKPMQFQNASEVSADLTINLFKLRSQEVTFYFAEVDSSGKPVTDGTSAGYEISLNKKKVTLNKDNLKEEVIVTNNIIAGSKTAAALSNSSSGFAGDSTALSDAESIASAQASESAENSGAKTTTGDNSPILPLVIGLVLSVGVISALLIMRRRRRR